MTLFPNMKTFGTIPFEAFTRTTTASIKGLETIAAETADYSKKSFEKNRAFFEQLTGVKKIDEAIELQSAFTKACYDDFLAHAFKIGEMYSSLGKEAFQPIDIASPAPSPVTAPPSKAPIAAKQS
jgi:hypothetical protein